MKIVRPILLGLTFSAVVLLQLAAAFHQPTFGFATQRHRQPETEDHHLRPVEIDQGKPAVIQITSEIQIDELLAKAKTEKWTRLVFTSSYATDWRVLSKYRGAGQIYKLALKITDFCSKLRSLTDLTSLALDTLFIGDSCLPMLVDLINLVSLDLSNGSYPDKMPVPNDGLINADGARTLVSLTNLKELNLGYNQIGPEGVRTLATLTNLTSLDLTLNCIGDDGAKALTALHSLTSLHLWGNNITDDGARALATLTNLTQLDLGYNRIGPGGAQELKVLRDLTSLSLEHNPAPPRC